MNYLYFSEGTVDGTGDQGCWPASSYLGMDCVSATTTNIYFKSINGTGENDTVRIVHDGKHQAVHELMATLLSDKGRAGGKGCPNFIVVADAVSGTYADIGNNAAITGVHSVTIDTP
tara:strand:- start:937 stop:1287 length:351 start_codon:yes stop_codon:yes gene_type:complete